MKKNYYGKRESEKTLFIILKRKRKSFLTVFSKIISITLTLFYYKMLTLDYLYFIYISYKKITH